MRCDGWREDFVVLLWWEFPALERRRTFLQPRPTWKASLDFPLPLS